MTDLEFLEAKNNSLENRIRALRSTLRDEFAKAALIGYTAHGWQPLELMVQKCYQTADLMLKEREK